MMHIVRAKPYPLFASGALAFHHDHRHSEFAAMGQGDGNAFYSEFGAQSSRPSAEFKNGPPTWFPADLELGPGDPLADTRSESFCGGLFGGKSCGEAFRARAFAVAIGDLTICINAPQQALPVPFNRICDTLDLDKIHACPDQHAGQVTMECFPVIPIAKGRTCSAADDGLICGRSN